MSDDFLCRRVLHSQPQPTFQRLQIAEQNVVDFIHLPAVYVLHTLRGSGSGGLSVPAAWL